MATTTPINQTDCHDKQAMKRRCKAVDCDNLFYPLFKGEQYKLCHQCRGTKPQPEDQAA